MIIYIIYMILFILINIALLINWYYTKSKKLNCVKIALEKGLEIVKDFCFILLPAMLIQMLAYYEVLNADEANIFAIFFLCIGLIYLLEMAWQCYKYRNMVVVRCMYNCDLQQVDKIDGAEQKKGFMLIPKACANEIIEQINGLKRLGNIKNRKAVGYIISIVIGIVFLVVGTVFGRLIELFA